MSPVHWAEALAEPAAAKEEPRRRTGQGWEELQDMIGRGTTPYPRSRCAILPHRRAPQSHSVAVAAAVHGIIACWRLGCGRRDGRAGAADQRQQKQEDGNRLMSGHRRRPIHRAHAPRSYRGECARGASPACDPHRSLSAVTTTPTAASDPR